MPCQRPDDRGARPAQALRLDRGPRRARPRGPGRVDPRRARAERRRQDDRGADPHHPGAPRRRHGPRRRPRRRRRGGRGAAEHRRHRPGRDPRRGPDRPPEPRDDRRASAACAGRRRRPARRELLEHFELTDAADRVLKGYSGGMRRRLDLAAGLVTPPTGALPRRADHGTRPDEPGADVGGDPRARRRRRRRCCSRPSTSRRPTSSPTGSSSSTTAGDRRAAPPRELKTADRRGTPRASPSAEPDRGAAAALAPVRRRPGPGQPRRAPAPGAPVRSAAGLATTVVRALDQAGIARRRRRGPPALARRRLLLAHRPCAADQVDRPGATAPSSIRGGPR